MTFMWTLCTTISGTPKRTLHPWGRTECIAPWWRRWHAAPRRSLLPAATAKGQLISKWFFGVADFLQETNENKSHKARPCPFILILS